MKRNKLVFAMGLGVLLAVSSAHAAPTYINNPTSDNTVQNVWNYDAGTNPDQELNLYQVYNYLYHGTINGPVSASQFAEMLIAAPGDETFWADGGPSGTEDTILVSQARYAGWQQRFGAYRLSDGTEIDSDTIASAGRFGLDGFSVTPVNPGDDGQVVIDYPTYGGPPATFGIFDEPQGASWTLYSEEGLNFDGYDHFVTAWSPWLTDSSGTYRELFIGVEDNVEGGPYDGADWDYQDMVVTLRYANIVPEPSSMVLLGMGVAGIAAARMRKRARR